MTINLLFPDGLAVSGRTYREVENNLRAAQWTVFVSRRRFRREFARRAVLWAGPKARIPVYCSSRAFLMALAKTGMCRLDKFNERGLA